jgi:hypothetical protein
MVREKIFEGYGWPDDHHVAAGRRAIFDPVEAKRSAAGGIVDEPRQWALVGTAMVATRAINTMHRHLAAKPCRITGHRRSTFFADLRPGHEVGEVMPHIAAVLAVERSVAMDPHFSRACSW